MDLCFDGARGRRQNLGPVSSVRFEGSRMRLVPKGPLIVAYLEDRLWRVGEDTYLRLECAGELHVHFEAGHDRSSTYGPFSTFTCVDGMAFVEGAVFSVCLRNSVWHSYHDSRQWPAMCLECAGGRLA